MPQSPIKAVFLDAGNTLFTERRSRPAIYSTVARAHGGHGDEAAASEVMAETMAELPSSVDGHFRFSLAWFRAFNERVLAELGVSERRSEPAHLELLRRFESPKTYRLFKEVPQVLDEISNRGLLIGVVSNWSERLPELLKGLDIADRVNFIVASADIKAEKPDRAIFDRALFRAGVPADQTLHVGDHLDRDVRGALSAGMRAALLDRTAESGANSDGIPVLTDLRDILALVEPSTQAIKS